MHKVFIDFGHYSKDSSRVEQMLCVQKVPDSVHGISSYRDRPWQGWERSLLDSARSNGAMALL